MTSIPSSIDEVTPSWLSDATGLNITAVDHEIIGVGIGVSSAVYRLNLEGENVPRTLVLKLPALDEAAVFTCTMLRMYQREVLFFDELEARSPIHVPKGYGGALSEDGSSYYLLMEDMGGHREVDQNEGMALADAKRAVDALAAWHAEFWGQAEGFVDNGAALSIGDDIYHGVLPVVFAEGWEKIKAEMDVHPTVAEVAPQWTAKLPQMLGALSSSPSTVVHGDYRADNIFFDDNNEVVLLDFQITGLGSPAYDLAYFVTQSMVPEAATANEQALFDRYIAALVASGIPQEQTAGLWEMYRVAALFCLVYPVVASRGMDLSDQRQYDLVANMSIRCARSIDDLDLRALL